MSTATTDAAASPFHAGEQQIQSRVGKRETMEAFGRRVVRPFMPDQHREFFGQLPFLVVGSVDSEGWPWASVVAGKPGFVGSPDRSNLRVNAAPVAGDPLTQGLRAGAPLGLLGIEMSSRRRNRLNAHVSHSDAEGFSVAVDQSFGNCPQYIQSRSVDFVRDPNGRTAVPSIDRFTSLDSDARTLIANADTFFVASYIQPADRPEVEGVDVSHRGGRPGFVKVEANTLTIPDFSGNYHFNTLGNLLLNPKAGLFFADFSTGDLLMLTGSTEILWEDHPEVRAFRGAERAWRFTVDHGVVLHDALPFRSEFGEYSANTLITGDWTQASATLKAESARNAWRPYRICHIEDESSVIRSFYLKPTDDQALLPFEAGQFLSIRLQPAGSETPVVRTYTASSAPGDDHYRISVKREESGFVSKHLHDNLQIGDKVELKAPRGDFFIDASETRPAVLLAGGVGVTPMIAMAHHVMNEGLRTRHTRSLTVLHAAKTTAQRAFTEEFRQLQKRSGGAISYLSFVTQPVVGDRPGVDYNGSGYINAEVLRNVLALDDYDFYVCGPPAFMQALYDSLRQLGVRDARIFAEAFGPAVVARVPDEGAVAEVVQPEAEQALIKFSKSGFEQQWTPEAGTLLETAEAHGLSPAFGCRNGVCGSCKVGLKAGTVAHRGQPSAECSPSEVLLCCAVPAEGSGLVVLDL